MWIPYECVCCQKKNVTTYKVTEAGLKLHFDTVHPEEPFTILYVPNDQKKNELKEKMERSKEMSEHKSVRSFDSSPNIVSTSVLSEIG